MTVNVTIDDYDYYLPENLIAFYPKRERTDSRLLISNRDFMEKAGNQDQIFLEDKFINLPAHLKKGDLLIFNDSKVINARLNCFKTTGGKVELLFLREEKQRHYNSSRYLASVLIKSNRKLSKKTHLKIGTTGFSLTVEKESFNQKGKYVVSSEKPILKLFQEFGEIPLPPYIKRRVELSDIKRYQTVYSKALGSVAAPTAGLHFDEKLLQKLKEAGVETAFVTLHVGEGTFKPIKTKLISEHVMHDENYEIPPSAAQKIAEAKRKKNKIIAVGTTSLRAVESAAKRSFNENNSTILQSGSGSTNLFIKPGFAFRVFDGLITNFHLPRSTLLVLVSAFTGEPLCTQIYEEAIKKEFRFFSYGDAMLIFRPPGSY